MIISASRRTDIPALYSEWFMNRLRAGYVLVPGIRNLDRLGRVVLSPESVDCIVFWTKNPEPMLNILKSIEAMRYFFCFQFTVTPYDCTIEKGLPSTKRRIDTFQRLSAYIGKKRVIWRYDPIFIDAHHSVKWQIDQFSEMCRMLYSYTDRCIMSFIDLYDNNRSCFRAMTRKEICCIADTFSKIAAQYNLPLFTCAEEIDLSDYGIYHGACIDQTWIEDVIEYPVTAQKDKNQRAACRCVSSIDIGMYNTCTQGCLYCYGTSARQAAIRLAATHDPQSPMIAGWPKGNEIITNRTVPSQKIRQLSLF